MSARVDFPAAETHLIPSKYVHQTFKVQVMRPPQRRGETSRYPVVYVTDGNAIFEMFKAISILIQMSEHDAPPFILVGIGYPSDYPHAGALLRVRDFSFPRYPRFQLPTPPWEGVIAVEPGKMDVDGGEDFQQFIEDELIPFIDEKHETIPGDRTYFGHSGGGSFGLFTLLTKSHLFKNYVISSPALSYHGEAAGGHRYENYDFALDQAKEFIGSGRSLDGIRVYISAGAQEEFEPNLAPWRITSSVYRFVAQLKAAAIPGLQVMSEIFPGETHMTAWPIAFIHGVQAMLGTRRVVDAVY
jgi:uncharacterized protein